MWILVSEQNVGKFGIVKLENLKCTSAREMVIS